MQIQESSGLSTNRILPGIQCFAWNKDGSLVAICPTTREIWIFETNGTADISKWTKVATLKEHFDVITALDWHAKTNLLLSTSTDRGVIVWQQGEGDEKHTFSPQLGMIKEKIANLCASWNARGDKFAIGSSSGHIYVGFYNPKNNFWVAYTVSKKQSHKASVTAVNFDNLTGRVVLSGSLDGTIQITSVYQDEYDKDSTDGPFGNVVSFGETLYSISSNGWINCIAFSPSCSTVCFGTHDCELNFADISGQDFSSGKVKAKTDKLLLKGNPLLHLQFLNETKLVGSGFDKVPILYEKSGKEWKQTKILDKGVTSTRSTKVKGLNFMDRRIYFNDAMKLEKNIEMKETDTKHVNYVNCMKIYAQDGDKIQILSTSDINGYLNYWGVQDQ